MDTKNSISTSPVEISGLDGDENNISTPTVGNIIAPEGSSFGRRLTATERNMLAGGIAGCVGKTATAPFSRLTVLYQVSSLMQSSSNSTFSAVTPPSSSASSVSLQISVQDSLFVTMSKIVRNEGVLSLWKGNLTSVIHRFPYSAINFSAYEKSKIFLMKHWQCPEDSYVRFACGSIAGGVACFLCYPLDIVRTRLTVSDTFNVQQQPLTQQHPRVFGRIGHILAGILKQEGIMGLYRGLNISLIVSVPTLATSFTVYGFVKESLLSRSAANSVFISPLTNSPYSQKGQINKFRTEENYGRQLSPIGSLLSGCISGVVSSILIFPADVIRKRMQVMGLAIAPHGVGGGRSNDRTGKHNSAGGGAGASSGSGQRFHSNSTVQHCRYLMQTEGIAGFYRGIIPEVLKVCPMVAITFCSYETSKNYFSRHF